MKQDTKTIVGRNKSRVTTQSNPYDAHEVLVRVTGFGAALSREQVAKLIVNLAELLADLEV